MSASTLPLTVNGEPVELPCRGGAPTVADLLAWLDAAGARVAVERNGAIVPRARHAEEPLAAGDRLEVVTFVGGG